MTMPPVIDKSIIKDNARKIAGLKDAPELILFLEVAEVNRNIKALQERFSANSSTLDTIAEAARETAEKSDNEAVEAIKAIGTGLENILSVMPKVERPDLANVETLLAEQIAAIRTKAIPTPDLSDLPRIVAMLDDIKYATQVAAGNVPKDYEESLSALRQAVTEKGDATASILKDIADSIPDGFTFDYDRLARIIKNNLNISVSGGGGMPYLRNVAGDLINPATEEKQDQIIGNLATRWEVVGDTIYVGEALPGTTDATESWRIQSIDTASGTIKWADGVTTFAYAWDDRLTLTYS